MILLKTTEHVCGPADGLAATTGVVPGDKFYWPGSCDTPHIAVFKQPALLLPVYDVVFRCCFSIANGGRVVFQATGCLNGPSNLIDLGQIDSNNIPPGINVWNGAIDVTAGVQQFFKANGNVSCNLGWQVAGDNMNPYFMYNARYEIRWIVAP